MTINSKIRVAGPFLGDGTTSTFPFGFKVFKPEDLHVVRMDADGVESELALTADFTVALNADQNATPGGTVTLAASLSSGVTLLITSNIEPLQRTQITNQGGFFPTVVTDMVDRLTILVQQQQSSLDRSFKLPLSDSGLSPTLPTAPVRARKLLAFDEAGNPWVMVPAADSATDVALELGFYQNTLAGENGGAALGFKQTGWGAALQTMLDKARRRVDLADFYLPEHGDDWSIAAANAFAKVRAAGGVIEFPNGGDIALFLDISGSNGRVIFNMNGCTVRPAAANQGEGDNSAIFYANNQGIPGAGLSTHCEFYNGILTGRLAGQTDADGYGVVNAPLLLLYAWARCFNMEFLYGRVAGAYSLYGQYNQFHECVFAACVDNNGSYGLLLDSRGDIEAANENVVSFCRFNTNKNHLGIKGGVGNRVVGNQFQNQLAGGLAAVVLDADQTGFGNFLTTLYLNYFEFNARDIYIGVAQGPVIDSNSFLNVSILAENTYNVRLVNNSSYTQTRTAVFKHPAGSGDVASISAENNDFAIDVNGAIHAAPTRMNIRSAATRTERNDNMLITTGQLGAGDSPLVAANQHGFKKGIARGATVPILRITQEAFAAPALRYSAFQLEVECINDEPVSSAFGYCSRLERFHVLITNNNSGAPQVFISTLPGGVDTGLAPAFAAIGPITLTAAVVGNEVTFSVSFAGAGSAPSTLTSMTCGYHLVYTGANPVSFARL